MGRVIILAGAPDAASLDWSEVDDDVGSSNAALGVPNPNGNSITEAVWQHSDGNSHSLASGHTEWRSVPLRRSQEFQDELSSELSNTSLDEPSKPPADEGQAEIFDLGESVQVQLQREWAEQASFSYVSFAPLSQGGNQSQVQSQQQDWSVSSADISSLSVQFPGALPPPPPPPPPDIRDLTDPQVQAPTTPVLFWGETTASQELIEHSLAVHDALLSSLPDPSDFSIMPEGAMNRTGHEGGQSRQSQMQQYMPATFSTTLTNSFEATASSIDTSGSFSTNFVREPPPLPLAIPRWQPLTHLVDIPGPDVLKSLAGRTVTVNIVAAVVAASAPRNVNVRQNVNNPNRRPASSLVELVLGDDTRSGFGITIWLDTPVQGPQPGGLLPLPPPSLASVLPTLHPQDIVLLQNLSLNVFNGKVYGSTLRRNMTQVHVLFRQKQTARDGDEGLFSSSHLAAANTVVAANTVQGGGEQKSSMAPGWWLATKTARVRAWALQYVFSGNRSSKHTLTGPTAANNIWMQPPVYTQDTQDTK